MKKLALFLAIFSLGVITLMAQTSAESSKGKTYLYALGAWQQMNFSDLNASLQAEGFKPLFENRAYFGLGWDILKGRSYTGFELGFSPNQRLRDSSGVRYMNSSLLYFKNRYGYTVLQKETWDLIPYIGVNVDFLSLNQGLYQDSISQWFRTPAPENLLTGTRAAIEPGVQVSWMPGLKQKDSAEKDHSLRITLRAGYAIGAGNSTWYAGRRRLSGPDFSGGPFVTLSVGGVFKD